MLAAADAAQLARLWEEIAAARPDAMELRQAAAEDLDAAATLLGQVRWDRLAASADRFAASRDAEAAARDRAAAALDREAAAADRQQAAVERAQGPVPPA